MVYKFFPVLALFTLLLCSSCKKDKNEYREADSAWPTLPADADGAFYCLRDSIFNWGDEDGYTRAEGWAWFENDMQTEQVSSLSVNGVQLTDSINVKRPYYIVANANLDLEAKDVAWQVVAQNGTAIPSFSYVDTADFPDLTWPALPLAIYSSRLPVIPLAIKGHADEIVCRVFNPQTGTISIVKLSGDQTGIDLKKLTGNLMIDAELRIEISTYRYTKQDIGGKRYYFVKGSSCTRHTHVYY